MRTGLRAARGLSLLELVVAIAVLAIGTISVIRSTGQARHALEGSVPRVLAQVLAENRAEALLLPGAGGLPGHEQIGTHGFAINLDTRATGSGLLEGRITVTSDAGPGAVLVTILRGESR